MSELIRSFIAVRVPPAAAEQIGAAQQRLRPVDSAWKWVDPRSFHMTLKFLGALKHVHDNEWSDFLGTLCNHTFY